MVDGSRQEEQQRLEAVRFFLTTGRLPEHLPDSLRNDPVLQNIISQLDAVQNLAVALANGNLEPELKIKGRAAGALKSLQASLRHLTWQVQQIASGDLSQQVHFMGEFAAAFNTMVNHLRESHEALDARAKQLEEGRREALNLMLDAQAARQQLQLAYDQLQLQMGEIRALQDKLREEAIRDPLTGCYNRRYLDETLDREMMRALREDYPVCFVMVDIDHFKRVNDTFGHPTGDEVLKALSKLLFDQTRAGDIVCRFGGEEFLVVLPNIHRSEAVERAEQWRNGLQQVRLLCGDGFVGVTASFGISAFPLDGASKEQLIQCCDQALYDAKRSGRNRVRWFRGPADKPGR